MPLLTLAKQKHRLSVPIIYFKGNRMAQRIIDLTLSALAALVSLLLSWPYWRDFEYWPESPMMWRVYFAVGFALAVYVFYVFLDALRTLFLHEDQGRDAAARSSLQKGGNPS